MDKHQIFDELPFPSPADPAMAQSAPEATAATTLSIEEQGWDEWEEEVYFSEWQPRG